MDGRHPRLCQSKAHPDLSLYSAVLPEKHDLREVFARQTAPGSTTRLGEFRYGAPRAGALPKTQRTP